MAGEELTLSATLDISEVENALQRIVVRTEQMVKASDDRIKKMGESFDEIIRTGKELIESLESMSESQMTPEMRKSYDKFKETILETAKSLDVLEKELRDIEDIRIDYGDVKVNVPRNVLRDIIDRDIAQIDAETLKKKLADMMQRGRGEVAARAAEIRADLIALLNDRSISGDELRKEIAKLADSWRQVEERAIAAAQAQRMEPAGQRRFSDWQGDAKALEDRLTRLAERGLGEVSARALVLREQLRQAMTDNLTPVDQLEEELKQLGVEMDNLVKKATHQQQVQFVGAMGQPGVGGPRQALVRRNQALLAEAGEPELRERTQRLMNSVDDIVAEAGRNIRARLDSLFDVPGEEPEILAEFEKLRAEVAKFERIKEPEIFTSEGLSNLKAAEAKLEQIRAIQAATAGELDETTQKNIEAEEKRAQAAIDAAKNKETATKTEKEALQIANDALAKSRLQVKAYQDQAKAAEEVTESVEQTSKQVSAIESIDKKLDAKQAYETLKSNTKDADALLKSNNAEVRAIASELKRLGTEAKDAYDRGETSALEFKDAQDKLKDSTRRVADLYGQDIPSNADRAQVSIWKLGNAVDRVGVRGVGGAIRIADAFRGIPPAAIAGVVAIAAVTAAVVKLIQTLAELAKKAASAFAQFTKSSVESARAVEVTDIQLGSFLRTPDLGEGYRNLLFGLSEQVGLNLTKDFARVIVPLAKDVEEVETAAEIAGTLAHAFQETEDAIANAIKQAAGGHFRPLIERFGLTEFEISKIQAYQETYGEFTGVLKGLGEALEFRGLSIDTLSNSLQLLQGRFEVIKEQVKITFGEPVADALGESLGKLFDIFEDRREAITSFFESLGTTVANVVDEIGTILEGIVGDVTDTDIQELSIEFETLGERIGDALEQVGNLLSSDDRSVVDVMVDLTAAVGDLAEKLGEVLQILDGITSIGADIAAIKIPGTDVDLGQFSEAATRATQAQTTGPIGAIGDLITMVGKLRSEEGLTRSEFLESLQEASEAAPGIGALIAYMDELHESTDDAADAADRLAEAEERAGQSMDESSDATRELIDERQQLVAQAREYEQLQIKATEAQEKIDEAERKFARDRAHQEGQLRTRFDRQEIDAEIKRSEQREDLFKKHMQRMLQLTDKLNFDLAQNELNFDRKEIDNLTKYNDKLLDIERDTNDKKLDIEKKFRERLKDIRAKFDLDAEEAIRRNDAVALLRIRRRMQLELDQAKEQRKRQDEEAEDSAENRREEAKIWLDRAVRDSDLAEQRKIDDIRAADEQRRKELIDQYNFEYNQIDEQYRRQREAIERNESRALDDLDNNFQKRREELDDSLSDEYDIVKEWKDAETDYMALKLKEQTNIIKQQYEIWRREGSLFRSMVQSNFGFGANGVSLTQSGYGSGGLGDRTNINERVDNPYSRDYADYVASQGYTTGSHGLTYRQHGGFVTSGNIYGINERGAEPFYATRAGIIASREAYLSSPLLNGGISSIDNSKTINADIYASDPTQMNPIQRTLMRHIVTEELLSYGA